MNRWIKLLTILCGLLGLVYCFREIYQIQFTYENVFTLFDQIFRWNSFFRYVLGMLIASLLLFVTAKPNDPLPWNWILILAFSILLIFLSHFWIGLAGVAAGIIAFFDYL